jgi:hypothetical protein
MQSNPSKTAFFRFRVLIEFDSAYNVFVARCLETGSVATADDPETVKTMIEELLSDEISYAISRGNFANLTSSPASPDVWARWYESTKKQQPDERTLSVQADALHLAEREVPTEISVASVG